MNALKRWVPLLALMVLLTLVLSLVLALPFALLLAVSLGLLIVQWCTGNPGRLLRALVRSSRRRR
jgi:hypothetical protein